MTTITQEHNDQLDTIKDRFRQMVNSYDYVVNGEFIANTLQSKDYLAFINIIDQTLPAHSASNRIGIPLSELHDTDKCVEHVISELKKEYFIAGITC